jgi:hypothetical protein
MRSDSSTGVADAAIFLVLVITQARAYICIRLGRFMIRFVAADRALTTALTSQASIGASITTNNGGDIR